MIEPPDFKQFFILLYKGAILRKRHYIVTFFEIIIPILITMLGPIMSSMNCRSNNDYNSPRTKDATFYAPFNPIELSNNLTYDTLLFAYTPDTDIPRELMMDAIEKFRNHSGFRGKFVDEVVGLKTEYELEKYCLFQTKNNSYYSIKVIGTAFRGLETKDGKMSDSLDYTIRYGDGYSTSYRNREKYRTDGPAYSNEYKRTPFLSWQTSVEQAFIEHKAEDKGQSLFDYKVWMQRFPYPEHVDGAFSYLILLPWLTTYAYLVFIINMIRRLIEEKSNGSKELLKMMGMSDFVYWTSTFINYFIAALLTVLIITTIYKIPFSSCVFMKNTEFTVLFLMMMLFTMQLILFGMAFSIFFNKAVFAIIVYIILHDVSFSLMQVFLFMSNTINLNYIPLSLSAKLGIILLPEGSLQTMCNFFTFYDTMDKEMKWSNATELFATPDLNVLMTMGMMILSCLVYVFLIWYFDAVWPWQPGVPKPFYFMFTKSYWNIVEPLNTDGLIRLKDEQNVDFFEEEPRGTLPGVVIQNLSKEFRTGLQTKLAVNDVSLNMYQGQITALLGHNGAGKTTTINILTGLYTPTSGTASINGSDILRNTTKARRGLGVCPQHNVLFDTLTAEEHLRIYAALKGVPWRDLGIEATKTLQLLKLLDKRNELVKNLSGGMKRKLSLGIAIIGGSRVLFLDEPTSGLDVEARRGVWDTLKEIRSDRTIILTTHYMEEADILGDRIAIMAEGEIQCCGSSMFLKQKLGTGYHLHVAKGDKFDLRNLTGFLEKHMPGTNVETENKAEVNFKLASSTDADFGRMFEELDHNKDQLGIASYGITITTMEDVFLNVANIADMKYKAKTGESTYENGTSAQMNDVLTTSQHRNPIPRSTLLLYQIHALFLKRVHYAKRHWSILLTQIFLPFIIICWCLYLINFSTAPSNDYQALKLDINTVYGPTDGFYNARRPEVSKIAESVKKVLEANKVSVKDVSDPTPYILDYAKKDMSKYWMRLLAGGLVDVMPDGKTRNLTAWYNGEPYHALPMSLSLMHSSLLNSIQGSGSITVTNAPLPPKTTYYGDNQGVLQRTMASVFVPLALAFLSAGYVLLPIHERVSKAKLLQLMSGIPNFVYWLTMFMWDYLVHFVITLILIMPFAFFSHKVFFAPHSEAIGSSILLMLLYGWASIPFSYLLSLIFKKGNTGFSVNICVSAIFGVAAVSILSAMGFTFQEHKYKAVDVLIWILRFLPPFSVTSGFSNLFALAYSNTFCESIPKDDLENTCATSTSSGWNSYIKCCPNLCKNSPDGCFQEVNPFTWKKQGCGRDMLFLAIDGFLYFALLLFLESNLMARFVQLVKNQLKGLRKNRNVIVELNNPEDSDVVREKERIRTENAVRAHAGSEALVCLNLAKAFKNFYAVDHLTFGIHKEECFGLLGVNGAGKTTTFRMLTGDCVPGEGNAFIEAYSVTSNLSKFQSYLGYCPQFDALIDRLTGREMLTLFGRLRGLTGAELEDQVHKMIRLTDLEKHADKPSMIYSGGNKRKLSIGIALIGFPPLILLDEPTAGVDPVSRRKIWSVLAKARNDVGSAVLLTTHSMEETEALCSRLAIMVNGQFRCLGSIQHLKSKYGQGYTLKIKIKSEIQENQEAVGAIKAHVQNSLPGAELKDEHQGMLQYQVVDTSVKLSHLFRFMSEMKSQFSLEDYLISETTLEQIFLTFAKGQRITAENRK